MRSFAATSILIATLTLLWLPGVASAGWRFTTITHTGDTQFGDLVGTVNTLAPSTINEAGEVAFVALVEDLDAAPCWGDWSIVVALWDGSQLNPLTDPSSGLYPLGDFPGINDSGTVSFAGATYDAECSLQEEAVWRLGDAGLTAIATDADFDGLVYAVESRLDASGTLAFMSRGAVRNGVYTGDGTESGFGDYGVAEEDASGSPPPLYSPTVDINEAGQVAFYVEQTDGTRRITRYETGGAVDIVKTGDSPDDMTAQFTYISPVLSMNESGEVAFIGSLPGVEGIFVGDGTAIHTILDSSTGFDFWSVSINDDGAILFRATRDGKNGMHLVRDGTVEKVLERGDPFGAETASSFAMANQALNDRGQMTFLLSATDGDRIVRADPVSTPEVPLLGGRATLLLMGILGAGGAWLGGRQRGSRCG